MPADTGIEERHLRNASIIDQERINRFPVSIIGVGAIGSHLAEVLAKLGVRDFTLIDFDEVDTVNLGVQGFYEKEVGCLKVEAVSHRLRKICREIEVKENLTTYIPDLIPSQSVVFSCVDSMKTRRHIFRHFCERDWSVLFDGRMAAESLRVFCVERNPESISLYRESLFPEHESYREACTARATIYSAMIAAAILCAQFKKWAMGQSPDPHIHVDLFGMDLFR
ncbi:MAG: ThiF family adenylyltransferase [Candidatus Omnitrophica bacterium]|nr:ThiF family adenylyltransferase [Candidatus Omnitrophota bacterium]